MNIHSHKRPFTHFRRRVPGPMTHMVVNPRPFSRWTCTSVQPSACKWAASSSREWERLPLQRLSMLVLISTPFSSSRTATRPSMIALSTQNTRLDVSTSFERKIPPKMWEHRCVLSVTLTCASHFLIIFYNYNIIFYNILVQSCSALSE